MHHAFSFARLPRLAAVATAALLSLASQAEPLAVRYLGQQIVPTGAVFDGTQVGGLSGIDYDARTGLYTAISDDRSQFNPARFYELTLDLTRFVRSNTPGQDAVQFTRTMPLLTSAGDTFAAFTVDPESVRVRRAPRGEASPGYTLLWTNEGQRSTSGFQNPTLREMDTDGRFLREFPVPAVFNPVGSAAADQPGDTGIRNNKAFESLTLSPDRRTVYIATENALAQDGPIATVGVGTPNRVASFDVETGAPGAQWVYQADGIEGVPVGTAGDNGLAEMLAVGPKCFLAVERTYTALTGFKIRLYLADARRATDVSALPALQGASYTPMRKSLVLDLSTLRNDDGSAVVQDNIEGITLGPVVDGLQTVVLAADNNFSGGEFTQFIAVGVDPAQKPLSCQLPVASAR